MTWLADVKSRCEAATAGPLSIYKTIPFDPECRRYMIYPQPPEGGSVEHVAFDVNGIENAVFIASAVDDLPRCIAWIERAKAAMDDVRDHFDDFHDWEPESKLGRLYDRLGQILSELEQA